MGDITPKASTARLALPIGILSIVAKQLVAEGSYATCASLNVTCRAVHEKTLQPLWRVNVQWAIKMMRLVPADVPINTPVSPRTISYRTQLQEVQASWNRLVNSRGARYIEFLAVPQFQHGSIATAQLGGRLNGLPGAGTILPKLKAVITLSDKGSGSGPTLRHGWFIHTTVLYNYGGEDLLQVIRAVNMLYEAGDREMKRILDVTLVCLVVAVPLVKPPAIKERWNYTFAMKQYLGSAKRFRPRNIDMICLSADEDTFTDACLDSTYWLGRGQGPSGILSVDNMSMKQLIRCAKGIEKAAVQHPAFGTVSFDFSTNFLFSPPATVNVDVSKLNSTLRATYLRASKHIAKSRLGKSYIIVADRNDKRLYAVELRPRSDGLATFLHSIQGVAAPSTCEHVAPWPSAEVPAALDTMLATVRIA